VLAACLCLFASPHLHFHDLGFLLVPFFGLIIIVGFKGQAEGTNAFPTAVAHRRSDILLKPIHWVVFLLAASLIMLFAEVWDPARYTAPYVLMAIFPWAAWKLEGLQKG
jgi:hypothetical protein